jgi:protein-S-isoprenylcysteine O-methyltransferase Ste14
MRQEQPLITRGPYARIRYPLCTALDGFGLSLALVSANWFFACFFILNMVGFWYRVPKEERMMLDEFGED